MQAQRKRPARTVQRHGQRAAMLAISGASLGLQKEAALVEADIPPSDRRRVCSAQEKAAPLAEIDAEGGKLRLVARRHGISESLLYDWRSTCKVPRAMKGLA